jgi:acyl carrier protein
MTIALSDVEAAVLSVVTSLAPDRLAPVTPESDLVDDLGYDSPRKMELVASLEALLGQQIPNPVDPVYTVGDVVAWVSAHVCRTG